MSKHLKDLPPFLNDERLPLVLAVVLFFPALWVLAKIANWLVFGVLHLK